MITAAVFSQIAALLVAMQLVDPRFVLRVDPATLPTLAVGDISITNNTGGQFGLVVQPSGCPLRPVQLAPAETVHIRCAGATSVRANIATKTSDGTVVERSHVYPASAHYVLSMDRDNSWILLDVRYSGR